jgi:ectoine hydroxylase-related dioxygenase (phytanoyl-CoA dioxygenase family)
MVQFLLAPTIRMNAVRHFTESGYVILPAMLDADGLAAVDTALRAAGSIGARQMMQLDWCAALAEDLRTQLVAIGLFGNDYVSVQCTYFEKSRDHNWLVAPHQDLSIPVAARVDTDAVTGWSEKNGLLFVQPPVSVLESLVALRLHIDDCSLDDGALKVVPGSHTRGRLQEADKVALRGDLGETLCPVDAGCAMALCPLLLHASSKATGHSQRRVLHFVFGPPILPLGLAWPPYVPQPSRQVTHDPLLPAHYVR